MEKLKKLIEELRKVSPSGRQIAEMLENVKPHQRLMAVRSMDIQTLEEEAIVQKIVDLLEPMPFSGSEEQKVRREMDEMFADGGDIHDPKEEQEWEQKLKEARGRDAKRFEETKKSRAPAEQVMALSDVKGLGPKSINKLMEAGIKTPTEFHALSFEQKKEIVGPIVAESFEPKAAETIPIT